MLPKPFADVPGAAEQHIADHEEMEELMRDTAAEHRSNGQEARSDVYLNAAAKHANAITVWKKLR